LLKLVQDADVDAVEPLGGGAHSLNIPDLSKIPEYLHYPAANSQ
jgi:hypothetical protein